MLENRPKTRYHVTLIKTGDLILCIDKRNCWLIKETISEQTGKRRRKRISGYYPSAETLAKDYVRSSEALDKEGFSELDEVLNSILEAENRMEEILRNLKKHDTKESNAENNQTKTRRRDE